MAPSLDPSFTALPARALADAALEAAHRGGASHADFRLERIRSQSLRLRDARLESAHDDTDTGLAVRVVLDGTWGFAADAELSTDAAASAARRALAVARTAASINFEPIELAPEPAQQAEWVSAYRVDPLAVPVADKLERLASWSADLLAAPAVTHVDAILGQVRENKFYADSAGTALTQQRVRVHPVLTAVAVEPATGRFETMRTLGPPAGRGLEYMDGDGWDWEAELAQLPDLLAEKAMAPSVEPGPTDLVIDPTNLWLTIHESVGHATELDRALGYEANYAGTSFATFDRLGQLQYGSEAMNVTADRTAEHGLATVGYDDEGVAAQRWDLVSRGVLVGYQLDRRIARLMGLGRSNGCAFADSPAHMPLQRMANVSLQPASGEVTTEDLVAGVDRGIYVVGDKSWSIDMQRYNFQFTGQRFFRIEGGRLAGPVRDVAYQATTTGFWGSLEAVGGPGTWLLGGAFNCGKGQPAQVAPVSHGCPSALFRQVHVLNTRQEGGR